jgi:hypothetical protein
MADKYRFSGDEQAAILRSLRKAFEAGDEIEFMRILRSLESSDEDPRSSELVKTFRAMRSGKEQRRLCGTVLKAPSPSERASSSDAI